MALKMLVGVWLPAGGTLQEGGCERGGLHRKRVALRRAVRAACVGRGMASNGCVAERAVRAACVGRRMASNGCVAESVQPSHRHCSTHDTCGRVCEVGAHGGAWHHAPRHQRARIYIHACMHAAHGCRTAHTPPIMAHEGLMHACGPYACMHAPSIESRCSIMACPALPPAPLRRPLMCAGWQTTTSDQCSTSCTGTKMKSLEKRSMP